MTLKTLRLLEKEIKERTADLGHVTAEDLRREAINWIKYYREYKDGFPASGFQIDEEFMKFFNIEDKELQ